jgi:hypothetical protein
VAAPHQVQVGNLLYTVVDDCTTTYWAIVTGAVTDEILGEFYAPDFTVETGRADLPAKTTVNGLFAVTGYPEQSFPGHSSTTYPPLTLKLKAPGFRGLTISVPVPAGAPFPIVVPTRTLRRLPVHIQGRVVNDLTRAPIPNAVVLSVDNPTTPPAIHTTAVRTPLYFDHAMGAAAQLVNILPAGGTSLTAAVAAGDQILNLLSRTGLGPNSIVQLSNSSNGTIEYGVVDHLGPGAPAAGQVFLRNALNRSYADLLATTVQFVTATLVGGPATLSTDANAGDGVLLASQLLNGTTLVVDTGTLTAEYHEVGALTDSDGYYGLDGIGRVREIFLRSSQGALQQTVGWFIEYDHAVNVVDLRLS